MIKSIRLVYQRKCIMGGSEQAEESTDNPTIDKLRKCFHQLALDPIGTAIHLDYGDYSKGIWFDSADDAMFAKCKVTYSTHNETDWDFIPFDKVKHEVYREMRNG